MSEYVLLFKNRADAASAISRLYDFADSFCFDPAKNVLSVRTDAENSKKIDGIKKKFCITDEA